MVEAVEVVDSGTVFERGKGSRGIPLCAALAKLYGVKIGDPYEICLDRGKIILRFPKKQEKPAPEEGPF